MYYAYSIMMSLMAEWMAYGLSCAEREAGYMGDLLYIFFYVFYLTSRLGLHGDVGMRRLLCLFHVLWKDFFFFTGELVGRLSVWHVHLLCVCFTLPISARLKAVKMRHVPHRLKMEHASTRPYLRIYCHNFTVRNCIFKHYSQQVLAELMSLWHFN